MELFVPLERVSFSRSSHRLEFKISRKSTEISGDFQTLGDVVVPTIYSTGGISESRVFVEDFKTKSVFLHLGRIMRRGISASNGDVNVRVPDNLPDWAKVFLAYSTTTNVLNDADNRHVRKIFDKKVKLTINDKPLRAYTGKVSGLFESIETLYTNLDKTMVSYFKEQLGKSNVFSVKFLPVSVDEYTTSEIIGEGVLEVRFRAKDGSLYTRNYGVRYGVAMNIGEGFIEDEYGNPVTVRKVLTATITFGGKTLDPSSVKGILRRYTHGTITIEAFMRVADPEFFVSTLKGSAYIEPSEFLIRQGNIGLNFLVKFEKKHEIGSIGDFGVTDLIHSAKIGVKVHHDPLRAFPTFLLTAGERSHLIASNVRKFLTSVLAGLLLNQHLVEIDYVKPKKTLLISGNSTIPDEHTPLFVGNEPVGVMSVKGLKDYITKDLPTEPEKYAKLPKSFPFKGVLHVGIPHKSRIGTIVPLMTPDEMDEGSRAYIYSLLVVKGKLIPIRLSTTIELVETNM